MKQIHAFIADPSVMVRQMVANTIMKMSDVVVGGTSDMASTEKTFEQILEREPNVLVLGLDRLDSPEGSLFFRIRREIPTLPVITISTRSMEGGRTVIRALQHGAVDFVTKPSKHTHLLFAQRHLEKRLTQALRLIPGMNLEALRRPFQVQPVQKRNDKIAGSIFRKVDRPVELVVIGSCTGGVPALFELISSLPETLPVPVLVVQHMPKILTGVLADMLDEVTSLSVREAGFDSQLHPGQVHVAPGGYHTSVRNSTSRRQIILHRGPKEHRSRPSIDVLLRSVVQVCKSKVLGVILSGGGRDGLLGARKISVGGGEILLQDYDSSLHWELAGAIHDQGLDDGMFSVKQLAREIERRVEYGSIGKTGLRAGARRDGMEFLPV